MSTQQSKYFVVILKGGRVLAVCSSVSVSSVLLQLKIVHFHSSTYFCDLGSEGCFLQNFNS